MSRRLTPKTTLEGLKREAKRWLKALRDNVGEARARFERVLPNAPDVPTLRDVQHALAREHGAPGWSALKSELARSASSDVRPTLERFERMASNLLDAYRTGTPDAMQRHWNDTWHRRTWDAMRRYVQFDLGRGHGPEAEQADISLDDARFLIAREHGFESWHGLTEYIAQLPPGKRMIAARLTDHGIAALAQLPRLRELRVGGMAQVTPELTVAFPPRVRVRYSP